MKPLLFILALLVFPAVCLGQDIYNYTGDLAWMRGGGFGTIADLVLFPDGKRLAAGSYDIRIYDVGTGNVLKTLVGPSRYISGMDVSKDGKIIAGGGNYDIALWDAETGELLRHFTSKHEVGVISLSADGKYIAAGGYGGTVTVWEVATEKVQRTFQVEADVVEHVEFSRYGDTLAVGDADSRVKLWNVSSGALLWEYVPPYPSLASLIAFSPDGRSLIFVPNNRYVISVDLHSGFDTTTVARLDYLRGFCLAYSPDGKRLAMGIDAGFFIWETDTFGPERFVPISQLRPNSLCFSADGTLLYCGDFLRGSITITDLNEGKFLRMLNEYSDRVSALGTSPDGSLVAAATLSTAFVHDGETGERIATLPLRHLRACESMRFSPDGTWLAGGCDDSLRIWQVGAWDERPRTHWIDSFDLSDVAWSPDGEMLAVSNGETHVWLYDPVKDVHALHFEEDSVIGALRFTPDGKRLIGCGGDGVVRIWDVESGRLAHNLDRQHTFGVAVYDLDIARDGRRFLTGALDGRVILWDMETVTPIREVFHEEGVYCVGLTPDGAYMLSGGRDRRIVVWDVATGDSVYVYHDSPYHIVELEISPDGRLVMFGSEDGVGAYHARWKPSGVPGEEPGGSARAVLMSAGADRGGEAIIVRFVVNPGEVVEAGVELYDAAGRLLHRIAPRNCESGVHAVRLPVEGLPGGIYFVRLAGDGFAEALPVTIVR